MNLIEAKNIVKVYRDGASFFKALDKVSINIKKVKVLLLSVRVVAVNQP